MADDCAWYDIVCKGKDAVSDTVNNAATSGLDAIANAVISALTSTVAEMGSLWTTVKTPSLTAGGGQTQVATPERGTFETQIDTVLGYASWLGLAVAVIGILVLGVIMAMTARRGEGGGIVNKATILCVSTILISGAGSLVGFLVSKRSLDVAAPVAFIQDQLFYLTLAVAALSIVIGAAKMAFQLRAEPGMELLKGILTLSTVATGAVVMVNALSVGTDALSTQIIDSSVGSEGFQADLLKMISLGNAQSGPANKEVFLGGSVFLIILGGVVAIFVNLIQLALMALRIAMLVLMAGVLPLSAAFTNTEAGRNWFNKVTSWTLAFLFYKPAAALIYGVGIKLTTSGAWDGDGQASLMQFAAGVMMIIASILALPVLIGFLSPMVGAVASGGGAGAMMGGLAAVGGAAASGAARLGRSGRGFGGSEGGVPSSAKSKGAAAGEGSGKPSGTDAASGAAGAAGGAAGAAALGVKKVADTAKKGAEGVSKMTSEAAGEGGDEAGESSSGRETGSVGAQERSGASGAANTAGSPRRSKRGSAGGGGARPSAKGGAAGGPSGARANGGSSGTPAPSSSGPSGARASEGSSGTPAPSSSGPSGARPSGGQRHQGPAVRRDSRTLKNIRPKTDRTEKEGGPHGANRIDGN